MPQRIDQVLAGFAEGDAISNEAVILQHVLRGRGVASDIFVDPEHVSSKVRDRSRSLSELEGTAGDILIHHYSIASPAVDAFVASPSRKVMIYHNITPGHFYEGYDDGIARHLHDARGTMRDLLPKMDGIWADSDFNAQELRDMGAAQVDVLPLLFSPSQFDVPSDPAVAAKFAVPMTNILFVGRLAPNKRIEDLLEAFAWYHRVLNRQSRLIIVGSERSAWRYFVMLQMYAAELDLQTVYFERYATAAGLSAYYDQADLFVTCSQHEGYCLPLVEAMHRGVPVIAHRQGGMPEALGGGGMLVEGPGPRELAALMHRVMTDDTLRDDVLGTQQRRMDAVRTRDAGAEVQALLDKLDRQASEPSRPC